MSNEVVTSQSLQERVGQRIREQIGDLLTEDDIKRLVEAAMQDAFFKRRTKKDVHNYTTEDKEPVIVELVRQLLQPAVDKAAKEWFEAHADEVHKHIDDALAGGILSFVQRWVESRMEAPMREFANAIKAGLANVPGVTYPLR